MPRHHEKPAAFESFGPLWLLLSALFFLLAVVRYG